MKLQKNNVFVVGLVAGVVMLAYADRVLAEGYDPVSLIFSESINRDSNLTRTPDARSDISSQTDAMVKLDKLYGRQSYSASGRFGIARYKNNEQFNNSNYDLNAAFGSEVGSNWSLSLTGSASENLNTGTNSPLGARLAKNTLSTRNGGLDIRYGVAGRWALVGSVGVDRMSYSSELQKYQDRQQTSGGLRLVYSTSDLLNFSVGGSKAKTKYPNSLVGTNGDEVSQDSLDLGTNWQVTGFTSLSGVVSFVRNSYETDAAASYNAVTSRINWNFTPRGATTYSLAFSRSTDSDNSLTYQRSGVQASANTFVGVLPLPVNIAYDNITTSLSGNARWTPTAKLGFTLAGAWYDFKVKRNLTLVNTFNGNVALAGTGSESESSHYTQISLGADYRYSRMLGFGCNAQRYKQTADITRVAYDGHAYGCNASITFN